MTTYWGTNGLVFLDPHKNGDTCQIFEEVGYSIPNPPSLLISTPQVLETSVSQVALDCNQAVHLSKAMPPMDSMYSYVYLWGRREQVRGVTRTQSLNHFHVRSSLHLSPTVFSGLHRLSSVWHTMLLYSAWVTLPFPIPTTDRSA